MKKKIIYLVFAMFLLIVNANFVSAKVTKCTYNINQWYGLGDYHKYKITVTDNKGTAKIKYDYSKDDRNYGEDVPDVQANAVKVSNGDFYVGGNFKCPKIYKCRVNSGDPFFTNSTAAKSNGNCTDPGMVTPKISREKTEGETEKEPETVKRYETISCGEGMEIPSRIPKFVSSVITIAKYLVPVALIFLGMYDFLKALSSSDNQIVKETIPKFIRRVIGAVAIFFVIAAVQFAFSAIKTEYNPLSCVKCFISGEC